MPQKNQRSAAQWAEIIAQYRASGLHDERFCREHDLTLHTFRKWKYRYPATQREPTAKSTKGFVEIVPTARQAVGPLRISLDERLTIECPVGMALDSVVRLITALRDGRDGR